MNTFSRKDYGKILVREEKDIQKVKDIIKEMDPFEYEYLPENFIAVFEKNNVETTYTHKFDSLDLNELQLRCWEADIPIMIINGLLDTNYGEYKEFRDLK